jgi:trigger factor
LKNIAVTRPVAAVTDAQVDERLKELAAANKSYEEKTGAAEDGDAVVVDFIGRIDGEAFSGGSAENAQVVIGSKQFIPGFEEQLLGAVAGERRDLNVTFPEAYAAEALRGKAAVFETTVKAVKAAKTSAPDDAWAKQLGFEALAPLREALRQRLESEHAQQSRAKAKRALFDALDAAHSFELPPRMVEAEFQQIWRQVKADFDVGKLDPSDEGKSEEALQGEYRAIAERRVRLGLVLAEIGRRHKLEVSDQEVGQAIAVQARNFPGQEKEIFDMYRRNPNLVAQVRAPLYEEKVVDYVLELVNVRNETVDRDTLFTDDDAPSAG